MLVIKLEDFSKNYLDQGKKLIDSIDITKLDIIVNAILDVYKKDKQIFIIGNGGSATTSSHFANDLSKFCIVGGGKRFRAISLTDNISTITAWANDTGYDKIFSEQLLNLVNKEDILIAFTVSGNSPNVIEAVNVAKQNDAKTIAFIGHNGGKLKKLVDNHIIIESNDFGLVESVHLLLEHVIINLLRNNLLRKI
jgi:D-sedoheptulose 7-phosphate isomerase|tara:strand:+ start:2947 stop:3531 length:585 start_codon:yes stop_codon:yes gene_type:complete